MARSSTTVQQILADARMLVGAEDYTNIREETLLVRYNLVMPDIYRRLNANLVSRFFDGAPLGTPYGATYAVAGDNQTWTAATKRLSIAAGLSVDQTGALVMLVATGQSATVYCTHVTDDVSGSGYLTLASGPAADVAAGGLAYIVLYNPSGTTHSIEDYRIDRLRRVHFTNAGNGVPRDEDSIEGFSSNANYKNAVAWVQSGSSGSGIVKKYAGASTVNSGGYPVAFFDSLPRPATAVSEYVDLPIEYHSVLIEEIARRTLLQLGKKIPSTLENPMAAITETVQ